jgi:CRP/FNR family transcriptional regulator, cyclic AMP receptor protein
MTETTGIASSFLAEVDAPLVNAIRRRAVVHHHRSGDIVVSEFDGRWTGIVLAGMARVFLTTPAGRQVTLRHARPGSSIGVGTLLGEGSVSAQAVTDCDILSLDTAQVARLARDHASLAVAIAEETSRRLQETYREVVIREQGSVRQRIARQLLHFAGAAEPQRPLVLPVSHEDVAEAVGSAREVVSRHLARFQSEEIVALERGRIRLVDPVRLDRAARQSD